MPTYWVRIGHSGYYVEANNPQEAKMFGIDKYKEQYPLRSKLRNPAKNCLVRLISINPMFVATARTSDNY